MDWGLVWLRMMRHASCVISILLLLVVRSLWLRVMRHPSPVISFVLGFVFLNGECWVWYDGSDGWLGWFLFVFLVSIEHCFRLVAYLVAERLGLQHLDASASLSPSSASPSPPSPPSLPLCAACSPGRSSPPYSLLAIPKNFVLSDAIYSSPLRHCTKYLLFLFL